MRPDISPQTIDLLKLMLLNLKSTASSILNHCAFIKDRQILHAIISSNEANSLSKRICQPKHSQAKNSHVRSAQRMFQTYEQPRLVYYD